MARILIIDDDPDLVQLLTMALQGDRHEIRSAEDPAEGLEACRAFDPELILLDYHMPGNTGAHLFETLRRNSKTQTTPILFMSAVATQDHVLQEVADSKFSRFVPKPLQIADLKKNIQDLLDGAEH